MSRIIRENLREGVVKNFKGIQNMPELLNSKSGGHREHGWTVFISTAVFLHYLYYEMLKKILKQIPVPNIVHTEALHYY